jgi:hypothetical protein
LRPITIYYRRRHACRASRYADYAPFGFSLIAGLDALCYHAPSFIYLYALSPASRFTLAPPNVVPQAIFVAELPPGRRCYADL